MFFEAMDLHRTLDLNSILWRVPFENYCKWTMNYPVTRAGMNKPQYAEYQLALSLPCDVHYATMDEFSWKPLIYYYINNVSEQR